MVSLWYTARVSVRLHPHARQRCAERGVSEDEVVATVLYGERVPARYGRTGFRRNFVFETYGEDESMASNRSLHMRLRMPETGLS